VGEIRRRLRPFDVAGTLTTGEIGILLQDASLEGAKTVVNRIRRALEDDAALAVLSGAPIGIASSRSSETASFSSFVHQAREHAAPHNTD
jgi:PleD family two-component response regulator